MRLLLTSFSLLVLLAVAPSAFAAEAYLHHPPEKVRFKGKPGEENRVVVRHEAGSVVFRDVVPVDAGDSCEQLGEFEVRCTVPAGYRVQVDTGDLNDEATAEGPEPVSLSGGTGDDVLLGGDGADSLNGDDEDPLTADGADRLDGRGGVDEIKGDGGDDTVSARDLLRESVACGDGVDAVQADLEDEVTVDCENVDKPLAPNLDQVPPGLAKPIAGKAVGLQVKQGTILVRKPGLKNFVALDPTQPVPVGTVIDATRGTVTLTAAKDLAGATQAADFRGGRFAVTQKPGASMVTDLALRGGSFARCRTSAGRSTARAAGKRRRAVRKLFGSGHGRFRTRGRHSAATVRGTIWTVEDRCNGTLTRVKRGVVVVENLRTGRTKVVRAGQSHFVRRAARKRSR